MAFRGFQTRDWERQADEKAPEGHVSSGSSGFSMDLQERLKKVNEYFDKRSPRQSSQDEIAEFLKSFGWRS